MIKCALLSLETAALFFQLLSSVSVTQAACVNAAARRSEWCYGFDVDSDYYEESPDTGTTREYFFDLVQVTASPDGVPRKMYAINGVFPAPTIIADWGDTVKVHITNHLHDARNGTTIHFHGIRQYYTNEMDGVASITECPVPPGSSTTYTWRASQYGTSWYHSHIGLQAWEGVAGSIVINGPATANYDHDVGPLFLCDWSHTPVDSLYWSALTRGPPTLETGLINGSNTWTHNGETRGKRLTVPVNSGKKYLFRLVNGAIDTHFKFTIDNHTMTVIAADFVPIVPYQTTMLDITMGQRYDVVVEANQGALASDFWIRAIPQTSCSNIANANNIRGILHYKEVPGTPSTTGYKYTNVCVDEPMASLVPHVRLNVGSTHHSDDGRVSVNKAAGVFLWTINSISFNVSWSHPTLLQMHNTNSGTKFATENHVIELKEADQWEYLIVHSTIPVPHPIHLHGHDFYLLAQGRGPYDPSSALALSNPPRRDVATLPAAGHLVIAFKTDNPGAWLLHCHIGWHTDMGLALQFIEQYDVARDLVDLDRLNATCKAWKDYAAKEGVVQFKYDDGI